MAESVEWKRAIRQAFNPDTGKFDINTDLQYDDETLKSVVDAITALQYDDETLKSVSDAIKDLQHDDETLKSIVDAIADLAGLQVGTEGNAWDNEHAQDKTVGFISVTSGVDDPEDDGNITITLTEEGETAEDFVVGVTESESLSDIAHNIMSEIDGTDYNAKIDPEDDTIVIIENTDDNDFDISFTDTDSTGSEVDHWHSGGYSNVVDTQNLPNVTVMVEAIGETIIEIQVSQDGNKFYPYFHVFHDAEIEFPAIIAEHMRIGARYVRLHASKGSNIKATVVAKP